MKIFTLSALLASIILFFVFPFSWHAYRPFFISFPLWHIFFVGMFLLLFIPTFKARMVRLFRYVEQYRYVIFPFSAFLFALLVSLLVFDGVPHVQDGIHYKYMAENFSMFRLVQPLHPHYDFFWYLFMVAREYGVISIFQPGFPLFLTPFVWLGLPVLANPLLTGCNVLLAGKLADRLFSKRVSFIAMLLTTVSPFMMITGGTFLSHPFCSVLTLSALLLFFRSVDDDTNSRRYLLFSGLLTGILVFSRPQNALYLTASFFAGTLIFRDPSTSLLQRLFMLGVGILPGAVVLGVYNMNFTGDPLLFPQDIFFSYSEPRAFCHRPGFGRGCPFISWTVLPREGVTLPYALHISYRRFGSLVFNTFAHPALFVFIPLTFIKPLQTDTARIREKLFLMLVFIIYVVGYFPFFLDGNVIGPRYFYEVTFLLIILAAAGADEFSRIAIPRIPQTVRTQITAALIAGTIVFSGVFILPDLLRHYSHAFWNVDTLLIDEIEKRDIHNGLFFLYPEEMVGSGFALMDFRDIDTNDNIFTRDAGAANTSVMRYYPDRTYYRVSWKNVRRGIDPPEITKIEPVHGPDTVIAEMEVKMYPLDGTPDLCAHFPLYDRNELYAYLHMSPKNLPGFSGDGMFCRFMSTDRHYTFGQHFAQGGTYRAVLTGYSGPAGGLFDLSVNNTPVTTVDLRSDHLSRAETAFTVIVHPGMNLFTLRPRAIPDNTPAYFFLDRIIFTRQ